MITDDRRDDALLDLLYDELPAADAEALRARLAEEDPEGLERLAQWQAIRRVAAELPAPEPDRQMHYDLIREARKAVADESKPFWLWSWLEQLTMRPALAGALLILLAAGLTWRFSQDLESTPDDALDGLPAVEAPQSAAAPKAAAMKTPAAKAEEPETRQALDLEPAAAERENEADAKKELAKADDTTWAPGAQDVPFGADDPGNAPIEEPVGDDGDGRYGGGEAADQAPIEGLDRLAEKKGGNAKTPAPKAKARRKVPSKRAAKPSPRTADGGKTARGKKAAPARPASKKDTLLDTFADAPAAPAPAPEPAADAPADGTEALTLGGLQGGEGFAPPPPPAEAAPPAEPEPKAEEVAAAAGPAPTQPVAAAPPPPPPARGESQGIVDVADDLAAAADANAVEEAERAQAPAGGAAEEGRAAATRDSRRRPAAAPVTATAEAGSAGSAGGDVAGQAVGQRANDEGLRFDVAAAETEEKELADEKVAEEDAGDRAVADEEVDRLSRARTFRANNQHRQAAAEYEAYLDQNRGRNDLDQVWWETARTYERLGDSARAIALYRLVVGGGGAFAAQAQARIDALSPPADSKVAPAKAAPAAAPSMDFDEAEAFPASESPRE